MENNSPTIKFTCHASEKTLFGWTPKLFPMAKDAYFSYYYFCRRKGRKGDYDGI